MSQYVSFYNKKIPLLNREKWLVDSLSFLKKYIIFLDPDNGLLKNKSKKISLKYVLVNEIESYLSTKKQ